MNICGWHLELVRPWWLAALAVLPVLVYYWRRSLLQVAPLRRLVSLAVRVLLVVALILTLCDVKLTGGSLQHFFVLAVDQSRSVAPIRKRSSSRISTRRGRRATVASSSCRLQPSRGQSRLSSHLQQSRAPGN